MTLAFALLLLAAFGVQNLVYPVGGFPFEEEYLVRMGANTPDLVSDGQWFRLVTANFLHRDLRHLVLNLSVILLLAATLEPIFGRRRTVVLIVSSCLAGTLGSSFITMPALSIGASTAAFGLVGATLYAVAVRWREMPRGSWLAAAVIALLMLLEFAELPENNVVDRGAHRAALVAGFAVAALLAQPHDLIDLARRTSARVTLVMSALLLIAAAGIGHGVSQFWTTADQSLLQWAEARMLNRSAGVFEVNNRAQLIAEASQVERGTMQRAALRMRSVTRSYPFISAFWDTQAMVHFRLGHFERAVQDQRNAIAVDRGGLARTAGGGTLAHHLYVERLARYLEEQLECCGALRLGAGAELSVRVGFAPPLRGESGERALVMALAELYPAPITVFALARHEGQTLGFVEVNLSRAVSRSYRFADASSAHNRYPEGTRFEVVLVDTRPRPRSRVSDSIRLWTFHRDRPLLGGLEPL